TDYAVLHSTSYIPNLENVTVANSLGSGFQWGTDPTGSYDQGQNLSGDGTYKSCRATNCAKAGFHCRNAMWWEAAEVVSAGERRIPTGDNRTGFAYVSQNAGTTDALLEPTWPTTLGGTVDDNGIIWECVEHSNVSFLDCATDGTTGSDFLFGTSGYSKLVRGCGSVRWIGGEFTGGPAALCTCSWMCESTEIAGGYYHDIGRGPTVGIDTRHFSIVGNVVRNCAEIGISIDTIIAFGGLADTPSGGSVVSGNCVDGCFIGIRSSCGDLLITGNNITDCADTSGWLVTFGTCTNVLVKGNSCIARTVSTNFIAFKANGGCTTLWEDNYTNSTRTAGAYIAVTTAGNVSYERMPTNLVVDSVAQSFTLANQDHLVVVNATASNARIYLPAATDKELIGWTCELWRKDGEAKWAVNVYVEDSDGAINGQTLVKVPSDKGAGARFVNQGSGQYLAQVWNGFPEWYTAVDGDPSPLVHQRSFIKLANTSALNVVAFDNGSPCQEFTVLATTTLTTLVHSTSSLIISSGASVVLKNNEVRRFVFVDSDASIASQIA
ncbi:MAG: hypothetical protein KJ888_20385, partial [Gammaproteobacteria bacterium]|nr:hypothetical protein [Gammaproteobacteria bacterium]